MSRMCSISGLFLIIILLATCLSAQTGAECLATCNSNCDGCVTAATDAWTRERMIIENSYNVAVGDAYYWYYYCCWEMDDVSGLPGRFSPCYSQLEQDLRAAELWKTMQLDFAAIPYEQALTSCFDTYRSYNESCPISLLAKQNRSASNLIYTRRGRPARLHGNIQLANITPRDAFLGNPSTDKAVERISAGAEGPR